jgi:hypothetical protein
MVFDVEITVKPPAPSERHLARRQFLALVGLGRNAAALQPLPPRPGAGIHVLQDYVGVPAVGPDGCPTNAAAG